MRAYFKSHKTGRGIFKWDHYFDIYHRHLHKFVGRDVHIAEVGVYSGGSLDMWLEYLGPRATVHGIDIEPSCKEYEDHRVRIAIGDQADRRFWTRFKQENPVVDVLIDDGGHTTEQQIITLEEIVAHLRPGGVYLCEDAIGERNPFHSYVQGLSANVQACTLKWWNNDGHVCTANGFQETIQSIHLYPFVTVIEKREDPLAEFRCSRRGTEWQSFNLTG